MPRKYAFNGHWFRCDTCRTQIVRYHNAKKCLHCGSVLIRLNKATAEDIRDRVKQAEEDWKKIPD